MEKTKDMIKAGMGSALGAKESKKAFETVPQFANVGGGNFDVDENDGDAAESSDDDEVSTPEPKQQRNSEAGGATRTALIATWNCNSAAPAPPSENIDKLKLTLARLGAKPDALALQETLFKDEARLQYAKDATPEYVWHCPPGKRRPCCETNERLDKKSYLGRGSWLLIRKGGPLEGGEVLAVRRRRLGVVLVADARLPARVEMLGHAALPKVVAQSRVAAAAHLGLLLRAPRVHVERADERDVHAERAVDPRALEAEVRAVRERRPDRVVRAAVDALLVARVGGRELVEELHRLALVERAGL